VSFLILKVKAIIVRLTPHLWSMMETRWVSVTRALILLLILISIYGISLHSNVFSPTHGYEPIRMRHSRRPLGRRILSYRHDESISLGNVTIRYKSPSICETTEGVRSYSGYVDLDAESHIFFWFFEARQNTDKAPITMWLNGGPGSDSLIGLFQGLQ
jgi:carboxypeptidase C (cathepsin A)